MRWLLRWLVDDADRQVIENDLAELYEVRRRLDGDRAAARWLRRQRFVYPFHLLRDRLRSARADRSRTMTHLWRDVLYSVRTLVRTPVLTATIVLTVGIGLGATTGMVSVIRAVLINPLPYDDANTPVLDLHRQPAIPFPILGRGLPRARGGSSDLQRDRRVSNETSHGHRRRRRRARDGEGRHRLVLPAPRAKASARPSLRSVRRCARRSAGGADVSVLDAALRRRSGDRRTHDDDRRRELHRRRRARKHRWSARTRSVTVYGGALAAAASQGPVSSRWRWRGLGPGVSEAAALQALQATNKRLFPIWRASYQDEKSQLGTAGSQVTRCRRRRIDAVRRARGRRVRAVDRERQRDQPAARARDGAQPGDRDSRRPRRVAGAARARPARGSRRAHRGRGARRARCRRSARSSSSRRTARPTFRVSQRFTSRGRRSRGWRCCRWERRRSSASCRRFTVRASGWIGRWRRADGRRAMRRPRARSGACSSRRSSRSRRRSSSPPCS